MPAPCLLAAMRHSGAAAHEEFLSQRCRDIKYDSHSFRRKSRNGITLHNTCAMTLMKHVRRPAGRSKGDVKERRIVRTGSGSCSDTIHDMIEVLD
jgi:hypothetical protein